MYIMSKSSQRTRINFFASERDIALLDRIARDNDTTRSQLIRHAIQSQYQLRKSSRLGEYRKILDEFQSLDADRFEKSSKQIRSEFNARLKI